MADDRREARLRLLAIHGADLAKWPASGRDGVREALLADSEFRRVWESERSFDAELASARDALDQETAAAGTAGRVRAAVLARLPAARSWPWRRIAAAVLAAAMLGGATDALLARQSDLPADLALVDPLYPLDDGVQQ